MSNVPNLSKIPQPKVIEELSFETIFARKKKQLISLNPDLANTLELESEPLTQDIQASAYHEHLLRQRINNAALATMLSQATGSDLDHQAANWGVTRLVIVEADAHATPPVEAVLESDDRLRYRTQLSLEAHTTAGSIGSYVFHALSASAEVKDVSVTAPTFTKHTSTAQADLPSNALVLVAQKNAGLTDPMPGDVAITLLSTQGNGQSSVELNTVVLNALTKEDVRPLTDNPRIVNANINTYTVEAVLDMYPSAVREIALAEAQKALNSYVQENHKLGHDITLSGLYAALHQEGVQNVHLVQPTQDIVCDIQSCAYCTDTRIITGVVDV